MNNNFFKKCIRHLLWIYHSICDYISLKKIQQDSCIFISHNGDDAGGAPVVLFELLKNINSKLNVHFFSRKLGKINLMCKEAGIPAYSFYGLSFLFFRKITQKKVKFVFINTLASYQAITFFGNKKMPFPVFLWVHEEKNLIDHYSNFLKKTNFESMRILCVSDIVEKNLQNALPQTQNKTSIFFYGCTDNFSQETTNKKNSTKFIISIIGRICPRKNQLQLVDAINKIPDNKKEDIEVHFVAASEDEEYKTKLMERINSDKHFVFVGGVPRDEMHKIYARSNLIVCTSIDDPLPVVVTEAMMYKCAFITSSKTGQAALIKNGLNGFVYNASDTQDLVDKIIWCKENKLDEIIENARTTYLDNFTAQIVGRKFLEQL